MKTQREKERCGAGRAGNLSPQPTARLVEGEPKPTGPATPYKSCAPMETEPPLVAGDFGARTALFLAACAGAALVLAGALVWNLVSH